MFPLPKLHFVHLSLRVLCALRAFVVQFLVFSSRLNTQALITAPYTDLGESSLSLIRPNGYIAFIEFVAEFARIRP